MLKAIKVEIDLKEEWFEVVYEDKREILAQDGDGNQLVIDRDLITQTYEGS